MVKAGLIRGGPGHHFSSLWAQEGKQATSVVCFSHFSAVDQPNENRKRVTEPRHMSLIELHIERDMNPVDLVEQVASINDWQFERTEDEISMTIGGAWSDYDISLSWMEDFEALHLACAFDLKITEPRMLEATKLIGRINEQLLIGHFDLWQEDGSVMFRHSLLLNGGAEPTAEQLECLLTSALEACERYFQAFQFVVWAGKTSSEALDAVLFETHGTA